jgi:acetyl-CoA acetyltransferase
MLMERNADDAVFGHFGLAAGYALAARRAMHTFRTGPETWKHIAVGQRKWANLNPAATMYDRPMTFEDYYSARWIVDPFRLFDTCLMTDGGRAVVITSAERARDLRHPPALIMGMGQHNPSYGVHQATHLAGPTGAKKAGEIALRTAGITLNDIDACEIYDCFTYTVEMTLSGYGFFALGEGKDFLKAERLAPGGDFPINTSGGQLSEAYFQGFTALTEAIVQLRGEAGKRQLGAVTKTKAPEIILVSHNGGVMQTHSTLILRR